MTFWKKWEEQLFKIISMLSAYTVIAILSCLLIVVFGKGVKA